MYHDVLTRDGNINENVLSVGNIFPESDIDFEVESDHELESAANHTRVHRHAANEFLVVGHKNRLELVLIKDKKIKHSLFDEKCKGLAFPEIFFKEKFGHTFPREHYLTSTKYFNQRLLSCSQILPSKSDYIFFAQSVLKNLSDQISMAMKKVTGQFTAGMFANSQESVRRFFSNNQGFLFLN